MKLLFILFINVAFIYSGLLFADDKPNDGKSKEDKRFEAQSKGNTQKIIEFFASLPVFRDGILTTSYKTVWSDGKSSNFADFSIESRVYGETVFTHIDCDDKESCQSKKAPEFTWMVFPIEMKIRGDVQDLDGISLKDLKIGTTRLLFENAGITLQTPGFKYENKEYGIGEFIGADIVDVTYNDSVPLNKGETFEIIFKLNGHFGVGGGKNSENNKFLIETFKNTDTVNSGYSLDLNYGLSGSFGIRINKKLLVSFFSDIDLDSMSQKEINSYGCPKSHPKCNNNYTNYNQSIFGAEIRYMPSDWLQFSLAGQKEFYRTNSTLDNVPPGKIDEISKSFEATSGMINIEVHW